MKDKKEKKRLVPYAVIIDAKNGNPDAMKKILDHYDKLIDYHSKRTAYDDHGNPGRSVDPEIKRRIQTKIINKIFYEFDPCRLPEGETLDGQ